MKDLDNRSIKNLIKEFHDLSKSYTKEWSFSLDDSDSGSAIANAFLNTFKGNIQRYNRILLKNKFEFLNLLDSNLLPAKSSKVPLIFKPSTGILESVLIDKKTQVYANEGDEELLFETIRNINIVDSNIEEIIYMNGKRDYIKKIDDGIFDDGITSEGIYLFDETQENLQEHSIFIKHDDVFLIESKGIIQIKFENIKNPAMEEELNEFFSNSNNVVWYCYQEEQWHEIENITLVEDYINLKIEDGLKKDIVKGEEGIYIKAVLICEICNLVKSLKTTNIKVKSKNENSVPNNLFFNENELSKDEFYPFTTNFNLQDSFFISSTEVFSKKDSMISLEFDFDIELVKNNPIDHEINWKLIMKAKDIEGIKDEYTRIKAVSFEYFNGEYWSKLFDKNDYDEIFYTKKGNHIKIRFKCPSDMQKININGTNNYYIKIRIDRIENHYLPNSYFCVPKIKNLNLKYDYERESKDVEKFVNYNNLTYRKYENIKNKSLEEIYLFERIDENVMSFYIRFSKTFINGPIGLYFDLINEELFKNKNLKIHLSTFFKENKEIVERSIQMEDNTNGFLKSGGFYIGFDKELEKIELFGEEGYFIKISILSSTQISNQVYLKGIYLNCIEAIQQETIKKEYLETSIDNDEVRFYLKNSSIIDEEVYVDEKDFILEGQELNSEDTIIEKDPFGIIKNYWVKWTKVNDFYMSSSLDRHYMIDKMNGIIIFGNGIHGKRPPLNDVNKIYVNYIFGGGKKGNVKANTITKMRKSIPFIDTVFNPINSYGGCDNEKLLESMDRKSALLKHRNRAITNEDYENLAKEASRNIWKVKCLENINSKGLRQNGYITMVVMPKDGYEDSSLMKELCHNIKTYLLKRAPSLMMLKNRLNVIKPLIVNVSIRANLLIDNMEDMILVQNESKRKLNNFLDPVRGNYDKKGWNIGLIPHKSMFYSILTNVDKVINVYNLGIRFSYYKNGKEITIVNEDIKKIPYVLVRNGKHEIYMDLYKK